ncbi:MAG: hypothetical protein ACH350_03620 [Parachlamydiaceae bacterium]
MFIRTLFYFAVLMSSMALPLHISGMPRGEQGESLLPPSEGGTSCDNYRKGLSGTTSVAFGNTVVIPLSVSDTVIQVNAAAHVPQTVFVTVNPATETSASSPDSYCVYQGNWTVAGSQFSGTLCFVDLSSQAV